MNRELSLMAARGAMAIVLGARMSTACCWRARSSSIDRFAQRPLALVNREATDTLVKLAALTPSWTPMKKYSYLPGSVSPDASRTDLGCCVVL
jgi:hypothetical protein